MDLGNVARSSDALLQSCSHCSDTFSIEPDELEFLARVAPAINGQVYPLDLPQHCPRCREQRRLAFRNENQLYRRASSLSGKSIISTHPAESPHQVYHYDEWWSAEYDATVYGREYDFNRPFFEQYQELWRAVPQIALLTSRNHNSEFTNFSEQEKNCYMVFASNRNENCLYSSYIWDSRSCVDCFDVDKSELLYDCVSCSGSYNCRSCDQCRDSQDLLHCFDCHSCKNLIGCCGLRRKEFHVLNKPVSEADFRALLASPQRLTEVLEQYHVLKHNTPRLFAQIINCEECSGANLRNCARVRNGFTAFDLQDGCYIENVSGNTRDLRDINGCTNTELGYHLISVAYGYRLAFCLYCHTSLSDSYYCVSCMTGKYLFGCNSLKNKEYAILNKSYTRHEYEQLLPRIIAHMRETGEWGQFFPMQISPWAYNDTVANDYYPLTATEAKANGLKWSQSPPSEFPKPDGARILSAQQLPGDASQLGQDFVDKILLCKSTGRAYRVITPELQFYQRNQIELPKYCPQERHRLRLQRLAPRKLVRRRCDNILQDSGDRCSQWFDTPFEPSAVKRVFCAECYLQAMG